MGNKKYFRYWGKARPANENGPQYHLLVYHSLDVAAVADCWWRESALIRSRFSSQSYLPEDQVYAWTMFFVGLHDLGKFDVRFQLKASEIARGLWRGFGNADTHASRGYWHGEFGYFWLYADLDSRFNWSDWLCDDEKWEAWGSWARAVTGHHGVIPGAIKNNLQPLADEDVIAHDKDARLAFIAELESMFLHPAGLSLDNDPPPCNIDFLAGFCSVCDWLGSAEHNANDQPRFTYLDRSWDLSDFFHSRQPIAEKLLLESGLIEHPGSRSGMEALYPEFEPRQIQVLVDKIPVSRGLTLIEAPTGSGKTEAALAYASYLLAQGVVGSIVFALPTQATANAMLDRLESVAGALFTNTNLLLAHGKAGYNPVFLNLKDAAAKPTYQDENNELTASVQCAQWLGQSRKRVFLGQIGVCTVDQVLISALPVKHNFVRKFGLAKSVLIIDEIHAYDSYMYGLMEKVLQQQKAAGGSALLLSATLPQYQREQLLEAWGFKEGESSPDDSYPLITHVSSDEKISLLLPGFKVAQLEKQPKRVVALEALRTPNMRPDDVLFDRIIAAAIQGANVVVICNLVADAQNIREQLQSRTELPVGLFHSRYRFMDRQKKEQSVLDDYGKGEARIQGGILVATQVVEQSLDLDFDWMISQLCPIDLLFQRLGRLHRHEGRSRPEGFQNPACTVLMSEDLDYELHKLIYGNSEAPNSRVLWRTEQIIIKNPRMQFPDVYRPLIEKVYVELPWKNEPGHIQKEFETFSNAEQGIRFAALQNVAANTQWDDNDQNISLMTRDGEMSLNVIPVVKREGGACLLGGQKLDGLGDWEKAEQLNMSMVPVPWSWGKYLPDEQDGLIYLPMESIENDLWYAELSKAEYLYSCEGGLKLTVTK